MNKFQIKNKYVYAILLAIFFLFCVPLKYIKIGGMAVMTYEGITLGPIYFPFISHDDSDLGIVDGFNTTYSIIWEYWLIEIIVSILVAIIFYKYASKKK
ncbi:MAG TPA: hypothetical protein DEG71_01770 [Clostridiales bacterium]|nr:hypothetical protein [Clostridiales bacterium]